MHRNWKAQNGKDVNFIDVNSKQLIYRSKLILIKIPARLSISVYVCGNWQTDSKLYLEMQRGKEYHQELVQRKLSLQFFKLQWSKYILAQGKHTNGYQYGIKWNNSNFSPDTLIDSMWTVDITVKGKIIKLIEDNRRMDIFTTLDWE